MRPKPNILLTRPEPGASRTMDALTARGVSVVKLPFTEVAVKPHDVDRSGFGNCGGLIVTSENALRFADQALLAAAFGLPVYAVGDATAAFARKLGFACVQSANGNAQDLCRVLIDVVGRNQKLLYLCGALRSPDVEASLSVAGFELKVVETYQTNKVSQLTYKIEGVFAKHRFDGLVFYSSVSAAIFADWLTTVMDEYVSDSIDVFCISNRTAASLPTEKSWRVHVSPAPRDDAMVDMIASYFSTKKNES